jgi:hypothetical protein
MSFSYSERKVSFIGKTEIYDYGQYGCSTANYEDKQRLATLCQVRLPIIANTKFVLEIERYSFAGNSGRRKLLLCGSVYRSGYREFRGSQQHENLSTLSHSHLSTRRMSQARIDILPVVHRADVHKLEGIVTLRDVLDSYGVDS